MVFRYIWLDMLVLALLCLAKIASGFINTLPDWNPPNDVSPPKRIKVPSKCIPTIEFKSVYNKRGKNYGPQYVGDKPLRDYAQWDYLITKGDATNEDRIIMNAMSENEGKLDALQAYDNQAVTVGAMQKTIDPNGTGEFPKQVFQFKATHPLHYEILFKDNGWDVEYVKKDFYMSYEGLTGPGLKKWLRANYTKANVKETSHALGALVCAAKTPAFQMKQVLDFVSRLHKEVLPIVPKGFKPHKLKDYVKSNFGKALVLDQHVNKKSYVSADFGKGLEELLKQHEGLSKNPADWGAKHAQYEEELLEHYGKIRRTTDAENRYKRLKKKLAN